MVVDQPAYPTPILRLALWRDQRSAYFAHKRERFGIAMADQRGLGEAWQAQVRMIAVLPDGAS